MAVHVSKVNRLYKISLPASKTVNRQRNLPLHFLCNSSNEPGLFDVCCLPSGCLGSTGGGAVKGGGGGTYPSPREEGEGLEAAETFPITFFNHVQLERKVVPQVRADWLIIYSTYWT